MNDEIRIGDELAGFRITQAIGEGGMARVFRGENLVDSAIVRALKVVHAELAARREFATRFAEEARILERLQHRNIVRFFGVRRDRTQLVMELELLEGSALSDLLASGKRPSLNEVVGWLRQAAEGVAAAHELGIVHRDLKPENLFLTKDGTIKVLDFGIARAVDEADRATRATQAGTTPGTAAYIAPEVWEGAIPAAAADVYALGLCLIELAIGHHPFSPPNEPRKSGPQMMFAHVQGKIPLLRSVRADAPELLEQVVARAVATNPRQRYTSARELADALRTVAERLPAASTKAASGANNRTDFALPQFAPQPSTAGAVVLGNEKKSGSRAPLVAGGALVCLAVVGGVAFVLHHPKEEAAVAAANSASSASAAPSDASAPPLKNRWVHIDGAANGRSAVVLGVTDEKSPDPGFRPSRKLTAPSAAYELQQHEVTWEEFEPFLEAHPDAADPVPEWVPSDKAARKNLPVVGLSWTHALEYCQSVGGFLPTEEQWEFAARGPELRPFPWGADSLDRARTAVFLGPNGKLREVSTSIQDQTPGDEVSSLHDMAGNAMEWTADLYRDDRPDQDESWVQEGGLTYRALRGLPPTTTPKATKNAAAYRQALCATGPCPADVAKVLAWVGFRCARRAHGNAHAP
jgi:serine/threonine-protein kinase